jgi:hypothetical protein
MPGGSSIEVPQLTTPGCVPSRDLISAAHRAQHGDAIEGLMKLNFTSRKYFASRNASRLTA